MMNRGEFQANLSALVPSRGVLRDAAASSRGAAGAEHIYGRLAQPDQARIVVLFADELAAFYGCAF